jgi:hypothetical protein
LNEEILTGVSSKHYSLVKTESHWTWFLMTVEI